MSVQVNVRGTDDLAGLSSHLVQINTTSSSASACNFDGMIVFSQPLSLHEDDGKYPVAHLQQVAYEMTIDRINSPYRCGVVVDGKRYGVALATYGDNSSKEMVESIAQSLTSTNNTGFLLGPYSSGLTKMMSPLVNDAKRLFVAAGSTQTPVFEGNEYVFGTLGPSQEKLEASIKALAGLGAKTIAVVHEDGSPCYVPYLAEVNGLELVMEANAGASPSSDDLDPYVKNLTTLAPDISVACGYGSYCGNWVKSMRRQNFSPKAQLFATCTDQVKDDVGSDVAYMMAGTDWHPTMKGIDEVTGWSASEFSVQFDKRSYRSAAYQSAAASASISVVLQAIEKTGTMDDDILREYIANAYFPTVKSNLTFDENGQAFGGSVMLQFVSGEDSSDAMVVYPPEKAAEGYSIIYPMPTWEGKDCIQVSDCELNGKLNGTCAPDGTCVCTNPNDRSIGVGPTALCTNISEDFTHVSDSYKAVGYSLFAIQTFLSLICMAWTLTFRKRTIVKASQPEYMALICIGVWIIACGIIPLSLQEGGYRNLQNVNTGEITDEPNEDIQKVDAACMAYPWLFAIGFALTFGALFAKIWRINKLMQGASTFRRVSVGVKDVAGFVIGLLAVEVLIMLTWQLVDPLQWQRSVVTYGVNGYPVKSVGMCTSANGNGMYFIIALAAVNIACLLLALYMSYKVRSIPSEYQESKWITASIISMFQVAIIGVPVLVIVKEETHALYLVNVMILFLLSSTVTLLMFGPKLYQFHVHVTQSGDGAPRRAFAATPAKSVMNITTASSSRSISLSGSGRWDDAPSTRLNIGKLNDELNKEEEETEPRREKSVKWAVQSSDNDGASDNDDASDNDE